MNRTCGHAAGCNCEKNSAQWYWVAVAYFGLGVACGALVTVGF